VNGVVLTDRDVAHRARRPGAPASDDVAAAPEVLQTVIRDELAYQKALALGLDADPGYRKRLDDLEAQVRTFRRQEMAGRLRAWAQERAAASDAEARAWFERNAALVQTRYRVHQIFYRGRLAELQADQADLRAGRRFEEVAWRRFPEVAHEGRAPWDLGELEWFQLPPAWRGIVDRLEPGQVSELIKDGDRAWIVRLASRRVDPAITFDTERERVLRLLGQPRADELLRSLLAEEEAKARVVFRAGDLAAAPPPRP
jgi:parvulin-like peptidyl-prolyl isomerase